MEYTDYDNNPEHGINYYRIKETDLSGINRTSKIVKVLFMTSADDYFVSTYSNEMIQIAFISEKESTSLIEVYDITGKEIIKTSVDNIIWQVVRRRGRRQPAHRDRNRSHRASDLQTRCAA